MSQRPLVGASNGRRPPRPTLSSAAPPGSLNVCNGSKADIEELSGVELVQPSVPLYFFDTRDNDLFIEDDVGVELPHLEAVKTQAALSLAELARDVLPGSLRRDLAVEARDERQPVLKAKLRFEAIVLAA